MTHCDICAYGREHGCWGPTVPPGRTHHKCCHTTTSGKRPHCVAQRSASFNLLPMRDGDASLLAERYPQLHECPVNAGGIPGQLLADLVGAHAGRVQPRSVHPPRNVRVFEAVLAGGQWTKVQWVVVGPVVIDVVNYVLSGDPAAEDAVLIGIDVTAHPDTPSEGDVTVRPNVPNRFVLRDLLSPLKRPHGAVVIADPATVITPTALTGTLDELSAIDTLNGSHEINLLVSALCCRTFTTERAADIHRRNGTCVDPATITTRDGRPRLTQRSDGLWGHPATEWQQRRSVTA